MQTSKLSAALSVREDSPLVEDLGGTEKDSPLDLPLYTFDEGLQEERGLEGS